MRKGKIKFYDKIVKSEEYQDLFQQFGQLPAPSENMMNDMQRFVCDIYGSAKMSNVNDARYAMFRQKYAPKSMLEPLKKLKAVDSTQLPPSYPVLQEKVKRTNYVTTVWINAHLPNPARGLDPTQCGWTLKDGIMDIVWFEGQQMPTILEMNASQIKESSPEDDNDYMDPYDSESDESEYEEDLFN